MTGHRVKAISRVDAAADEFAGGRKIAIRLVRTHNNLRHSYVEGMSNQTLAEELRLVPMAAAKDEIELNLALLWLKSSGGI